MKSNLLNILTVFFQKQKRRRRIEGLVLLMSSCLSKDSPRLDSWMISILNVY